jgi:ribosomal protein L32
MRTTTSPLTSASKSGARKADDPPAGSRPKITFVSTCPKCGHERLQHGYTRRVLYNLLNTRRKIDAYCIVCNVCWPIGESERRAISPQ